MCQGSFPEKGEVRAHRGKLRVVKPARGDEPADVRIHLQALGDVAVPLRLRPLVVDEQERVRLNAVREVADDRTA